MRARGVADATPDPASSPDPVFFGGRRATLHSRSRRSRHASRPLPAPPARRHVRAVHREEGPAVQLRPVRGASHPREAVVLRRVRRRRTCCTCARRPCARSAARPPAASSGSNPFSAPSARAHVHRRPRGPRLTPRRRPPPPPTARASGRHPPHHASPRRTTGVRTPSGRSRASLTPSPSRTPRAHRRAPRSFHTVPRSLARVFSVIGVIPSSSAARPPPPPSARARPPTPPAAHSVRSITPAELPRFSLGSRVFSSDGRARGSPTPALTSPGTR